MPCVVDALILRKIVVMHDSMGNKREGQLVLVLHGRFGFASQKAKLSPEGLQAKKLNFEAAIKSAASAASLDVQGSPRTESWHTKQRRRLGHPANLGRLH